MEALPLVTQQETIACGLLADRHRRPPECVAIVQNRRSISAFSAEGIVRDALAFVERKGANNIQVKDLTNAVRVKYRTLLRAFQRHLQMTPKRYLRLRQLKLFVARCVHRRRLPQ
jgi:transcriptional regulator GlxA family with amidase domain